MRSTNYKAREVWTSFTSHTHACHCEVPSIPTTVAGCVATVAGSLGMKVQNIPALCQLRYFPLSVYTCMPLKTTDL